MDEEKKDQDIIEDDVQDDVQQDNSSDSSAKDSKNNGGDDDSKKDAKTFTQDQVNRMMTREKKQGRNAAYKEMGIDPKDTKMVNMFKAFVESQKTDEQKAAEKSAAEQSALEEANRKALIAEAKAEVMMLGVKANYVEDAVALALSRVDDENDIKTVISGLKNKYPIWFEPDADDKKSAGKKGTGSSINANDDKAKKGKGKEQQGLGARLAAQRKATAGKKSYWK